MIYRVIEANSAKALEEQVQGYLDDGWEPLGGMAVATYGAGQWWYYQAVIAQDEVDEQK